MKKRYLLFICGVGIFVLFICFSEEASISFIKILTATVRSLVPSVFPFMIAGELIASALSDINPEYYLRTVPFLGIFLGFPIGASGGAILYKRGDIDRRELMRISSCCGMPGAGFILGAGKGLFGLEKAVILYFICISTALCAYFSVPSGEFVYRNGDNKTAPASFLTSVSSAIRKSSERMLTLAGFISFFYAFASLITLKLRNNTLRVLTFGLLEFSGGITECSSLEYGEAYVMFAFIASFSGLSVFMQCVGVGMLEGIRPVGFEYPVIRLGMGLYSAFLSFIVLNLESTFISVTVIVMICVFSVIFSRLLQRINRKTLEADSCIRYNI